MITEPTVAVGLIENAPSVTVRLLTGYRTAGGKTLAPGSYLFTCENGAVTAAEGIADGSPSLPLIALSADARFRLEVTIGIDFHWQRKKEYTFGGSLRLRAMPGDTLTVVNDIPLESYIHSVSCSEMSARSPGEFLKAHSIISRSWLLAQLDTRTGGDAPVNKSAAGDEIIRWYDRQSHTGFDVCADDHCQRYQGVDMIASGQVTDAVEATRGQVLMYGGRPCDARFSKCCGGVTEDFRLAWSDTPRPYLMPVADTADRRLPSPPLADEESARRFITTAPPAYCNCTDRELLGRVLNSYDQSTTDFYRWTIRLAPDEIAGLLAKKLSFDLGRITALTPVERGLSSRLKKLRITGDKASVVIGKELEIRRALSPTHLYSSAFVVDAEGPPEKPDSFILHGAGWGHGVGLCQIGAAVMAENGVDYRKILQHYYPGSTLERLY